MKDRERMQPEGMPERIRKCFEESGMNCVQIGKILGVERKMVYAYRDGKASVNAVIIEKMCKLFNVSADYLIFGVKK